MSAATDYVAAGKRFWLHWHLPIRAHVGVDVDFTPTWMELDNRQLVWTLSNAPAWMSIDASSGKVSGSPSAEATHSDIVITGTRDDNTTIAATFTCVVDNSKFVFVSTSGNDANPGTLASPKATVNGALALLDNTAGKTIYVRGGNHTTGYIATGGGYDSTSNWFSGKDRTTSDFHEIRGYPGETATLKFTTGGLGGPALAGKGCVISHLKMGEGTRINWPNALIVSAAQTLVADCEFYNTDGTDNLAGLQVKPASMASNDYVTVSRCIAHDNYNRSEPTNNNSTDFLFFTDVGDKASGNNIFVLNCKGYNSVHGFKVKTTGSCGLVFQGCESSNNTAGGFTVGKCLVNYCVSLDNAQQDIKSSTDNGVDGPAYWANCTIVNANIKSTYYYLNNIQSGAANGSIYERCVFAVLANTSGPIQRLWEYDATWADGRAITFQNNVYWGSDATPMLAGGSAPNGNLTFAQWKSKSTGGIVLDTTGSVFSDPQFVNAAAGRLDVPSNSPAAGFTGFFAGAFQPGKTVGTLGTQTPTLTNFQINGDAATPIPPVVVPVIARATTMSAYAGIEGLQGSGSFEDVTPHDTNAIQITRAIYVGGSGNIAVVGENQTASRIFYAVPAGTTLDIRVQKVLNTGTTATHIMALY